MVVTGSLEDFLRYDGDFATGSRFNRPDQINSTVMSIPPGWAARSGTPSSAIAAWSCVASAEIRGFSSR
jgi:hypothetical protein